MSKSILTPEKVQKLHSQANGDPCEFFAYAFTLGFICGISTADGGKE